MVTTSGGKQRTLEQAARDLAARGYATVARVETIVERARALLEAGGIQPTPNQEEPYAWKADELFPLGTPMRIYLTTVEDFATGEGLTVSFFAGRAPSANAFRRLVAREVDAHLANTAIIAEGRAAKIPFGVVFLSDALRAKLEQIERGENQPGAFAFFARWHANYS
jgi:hypothetical protein